MEEKIDCRIPKSFYLILMLFLSIKGRVNFLQLERFSNRCESRFRYFFEQSFDFLTFNKILIKSTVKGKIALAFDPSFILKAGRKTPGIGYLCLCFFIFFMESANHSDRFGAELQANQNGDWSFGDWRFWMWQEKQPFIYLVSKVLICRMMKN